VVLLSAIETSADSQIIGLEAGADGYIARPIENRELLARVQALLRIKAPSRRCAGASRVGGSVAERTAELARQRSPAGALAPVGGRAGV
jgi:DNA-binding response OmpR family regulator